MRKSELTHVVKLARAVPGSLHRDAMAKLYHADELLIEGSFSDDGTEITITLAKQADQGRIAELERRVHSVAQAVIDNALDLEIKILVDRSGIETSYRDDPIPSLQARRALVNEGPGIFSLGPELAAITEWFDGRMRSVARDMNAAPYHFPALMSPALLERVQYFSNFPHALGFVSHVREDLEAIEAFSKQARSVDGVVEAPSGSLSTPKAMLSPTVCQHLYNMLADQPLRPEGLTATALGHCFRYESRSMESLARVWNFTMREIIFVGDVDYVRAGLEDVRNRMLPVLDALGLNYRIETATDPFFIGSYKSKALYQRTFDLKYEVRAILPFLDRTIALGSYNYHQDFFGRHLGITLANGAPAHTACVGFGFERIVMAVISQHGPDPKKWPAALNDISRV